MDAKLLNEVASQYGTPLYVYDGSVIIERVGRFRSAVAAQYEAVQICYAVKANSNKAILKIIQREGCSCDVVSLGELDAALYAGFDPSKLIYTSSSKSSFDLEAAVESGVVVNLDNLQELEIISELASRIEDNPRVSFRINPDIDAKTHPKISTALKSSKFGVHVKGGQALECYRRAAEDENLVVSGVHVHIGSQVTDLTAFKELGEKIISFVVELKEKLGIELEFIDVGGGLGIPYEGEDMIGPEDYAKAIIPPIKNGLKKLGYSPELWFEPGRYLVGEAGVLLTKVNTVKTTSSATFLNVDSGFNTLIRPAMYEAHHRFELVGKENRKKSKTYTVAGNLCESGDIFGVERKLPHVERGDLLAILDAGAYGYSMASNYNSIPLPAEILILDGKAHLIRKRQTIEDLYQWQKEPPELE
ncbi:diaminopimelate decarboxylase [Candidatus Altiarchaeota archaeon]